ncbi:decarboxylase [Candidatus Woesearchaeota archaeon]|nr:MAG: decarboxylase [Candidatus Woesearchaeota archaeon]
MQNAKFILSRKKAVEQYNKVKALADAVSYSSKTNQDVTRILEDETDSMFSVHFINELKHVKDMSRVIFLAQGWTEDFIKDLVNRGIKSFIVDNESDLDIFLKFLEGYDGKLNLMLRLKLKEMTIRTERYFVFGMRAAVINRRIKELRKHPKISELGIHFHRKTQNMSEWNLKYELSQIIEEDTLKAIDVMNIGGGLPAEYANTNVNVLDSIIKRINELREWLHSYNIKMIIEPGRFIAAPAAKLVTYVIGVHENNIIVNASVYNSDMDAIIVPVKLLVEGELEKGQGEPFVIKGITPCSMDIFRYRVYLNRPKVGDRIVFLNAGAYNFSSDFCDLEKLPTEVVE